MIEFDRDAGTNQVLVACTPVPDTVPDGKPGCLLYNGATETSITAEARLSGYTEEASRFICDPTMW